MRRAAVIEDLLKDLAYAFRLLRKSPGFSATAIGSLALGIGANTAIFTLVNVLLLRPLPFERPDRLVTLFERSVVGSEQDMSPAPGNFLNWQQSSTLFQSLSAYRMQLLTLSSDAPGFEPQRVAACVCSGNLFTTLGVSPVLGRTFRPDEDRFGAPRVAAISYDLWQRQFGGSPDLIGGALRLNDQDYRVIAVMPRTLTFPSRTVDIWVPLRTALGAGRGRIVRQLVTETVVLGLAGGSVGAVLAVWLIKLLATRAPGADALLQSGTVTADPGMFLFAFAVAIATGIAVGLVPA